MSGWKSFLKLLRQQTSLEEINEILDIYLTSDEINMIEMRYHLIGELLLKQKSQREIAKSLDTSIATVTRGSNFLKSTSETTKNKILQFYTQEEV